MTILNDKGVAVGPVVRPRRRFLRFLGYGVLTLLAIALVAHWVWVASGSNRWELATDKNGVKVWTLKTPGSSLLLVRGEVRLKTKLAGMVSLLEDLKNCVDAHCYDADVIERMPTVPGRYAAYVKFKFDVPGGRTRQYVLLQEHQQDAASKAMVVNLIAAPDRLPRDTCCLRVTHLHNTWQLTPQPNGDLDVSLTQDTDLGGLPYPLTNFALTKFTYESMHLLPQLMAKDKYRNAKVDGILEAAGN